MPDRSKIPVLYLSYDGLTDPLGQSQIMPYVKGLSKLNFQFTLISFEKKNTFLKYKNEVTEWSRVNNVDWKAITYHKNPPVLSTLYDLHILWNTCARLHQKKNFKIVHCRSYLTSLVGLRMKKKYGLKFIFDMRGFWADERVEGGLWNLKNPIFRIIYNYFKKKEKQFLTEADHVISLTENAKQELLSWGLKCSPITVIPTCVDLELFEPDKIRKEDQEALRAKIGIKQSDFVLLYLGSWGTWYLTNEMLNFFSELKKQKQNVKFLIVTADRVDLKDFPHKEDIIVTTALRHIVPLYVSLAHASVFFIKPTFSKKASSATKMGEIMAMNIPIVTNSGWGDVVQILDGSKMGIVIERFSQDSFFAAIRSLNAVREGKQTLSISTEQLSLASGISNYDKVIQSILN